MNNNLMYFPDLIFDIGAFQGEDADFYLRSGYRVVSVEANPAFADIVRRKHETAIRDNRLIVVNGAIALDERQIPFYVHDHGDWSSLHKSERFTDGSFHTISVTGLAPARLFAEFGVPYYVKIDIEGADHLVLEAIAGLPRKPPYVSYELGPATTWADALHSAGYGQFKLVQQDALPKRRYLLGSGDKQAPYKFTGYHSGPFGEESHGEWVGLERLNANVEAIDWSSGLGKWFDVHAKYGPPP